MFDPIRLDTIVPYLLALEGLKEALTMSIEFYLLLIGSKAVVPVFKSLVFLKLSCKTKISHVFTCSV